MSTYKAAICDNSNNTSTSTSATTPYKMSTRRKKKQQQQPIHTAHAYKHSGLRLKEEKK